MRFLQAFAFLLLAPVVALCAERSLPSASDLIAGYRQNFLRLLPCRVLYSETTIDGDLEQTMLRRSLEAMRRVDLAAVPQQARDAVAKDIEEMEEKLAPGRMQRTYWAEFITDGRQFQYKTLRNPMDAPAGAEVSKYSFPTGRLTAETLLSDYAEIVVVAGTNVDGRVLFREWGGLLDHTPVGRTSATPIELTFPRFPFAGRVRSEWGANNWQQLDHVMSHDPAEYTVLRFETVGGIDLTVLEHRTRRTQPQNPQNPVDGELVLESYQLMWIDENRGFLPMKIQAGARLFFGDLQLNKDHDPPEIELDVVRCEPVGRAFYPANVVTKTYGNDDLPPGQAAPSYKEYLNGVTFDFPRGVIKSVVFDATEIESGASAIGVPLEDFPFPDRTRFFDGEKNRGMIAGLTEEEVDREIERAMPKPIVNPPDRFRFIRSRAFWIFCGNLLIVTLLFVAVWRRAVSRRV